MRQIRLEFHIQNKEYCLFIGVRFFKIKYVALLESVEGSRFCNNLPVKISTSTRKEEFLCWLGKVKKRREWRNKPHRESREL